MWHPFSQVKDEVAKIVFSEVLQAMAVVDEEAASHRMLTVSRLAFDALQINPEDPQWVKQDASSSDALKEQFKLEKKEQLVQRTSEEEWMKETAFVLVPNDWSPIRAPLNGDISFFYLKEKREGEPILARIPFGKELIAADAERFLAERLLQVIAERHSITLPLESKE